MSDLIDPRKGPKPRQSVVHSDGVGLKMATIVDGGITVEDEKQIYELGAGQWMVVTLEAWAHLMQRVLELQTAADITGQTPISRRRARIQRRKDQRN